MKKKFFYVSNDEEKYQINFKGIYLLIIVLLLLILLLYMIFNKEKNRNANFTSNPYTYIHGYIEKDIEPFHVDNNIIEFKQLKENLDVANNFESKLDNYFVKRFKVGFYNDGKPDFSIKDTYDSDFEDVVNYVGDEGLKLMKLLYNSPEHRFKSIGCNYGLSDQKINVFYTDLALYSGRLSMFMMHDNTWIDDSDKEILEFLDILKNSDNQTTITNINVNLYYTYNQRTYNPGSIEYERYQYYAYFEIEDRKYLLHHTTSYTILNGVEPTFDYTILLSQEERRESFINVLYSVIDSLTKK